MARFTGFESTAAESSPVQDFWRHPLVPLKTALQPVSHRIRQVDFYLRRAMDLCHFPSQYRLTREESAAIYLYTMDGGGHSFYKTINKDLRTNSHVNIKPWLAYLKLFSTALQKLPTAQQNLWRGVPCDMSSEFQKGNEFTWWAITSCTTSISVLEKFLPMNSTSTLFMIEAINGKDISEYSEFQDESEVILHPGTRVRVVSDPLRLPQAYVIHLQEVSGTATDLSSARLRTHVDRYGNKYQGDMRNGKKHGTGKMSFTNGDSYSGCWVDDYRTGDGVYTFASGDRYTRSIQILLIFCSEWLNVAW